MIRKHNRFNETFSRFVISENIVILEGIDISVKDAIKFVNNLKTNSVLKIFINVVKFIQNFCKKHKLIDPAKLDIIINVYNFIMSGKALELITKKTIRKYIYALKSLLLDKIWPKIKETSIVQFIIKVVKNFKTQGLKPIWDAITQFMKNKKAGAKKLLDNILTDISKVFDAADYISKFVKYAADLIEMVKKAFSDFVGANDETQEGEANAEAI